MVIVWYVFGSPLHRERKGNYLIFPTWRPTISCIWQMTHLPEWPEAQRAMPNEFLSSALFNCRNRKQPRQFMKDVEIAVIGDGQIVYRGEEFRQGDELVWQHLVHLVKKSSLGECGEFTPYSFIKALDWSVKGQDVAEALQGGLLCLL